jgi:hypothetical protein
MTDMMGGLLGTEDPDQQKGLLGLLAAQIGGSILSANQPGVSSGQALGAGLSAGANGIMQAQQLGALNEQRKSLAMKNKLEATKLGYDVQNLQRQNQMFGSMFGSPYAAQPTPADASAYPATDIFATANGLPSSGGATPANLPTGPQAGSDVLGSIGLTRDQVKAAYAFGGPAAASKLIEAAATKRIETGQWEDVGGGMQRNKLTGETKPISPTLVNVAVNGPKRESSFNQTLGTEQGKDAAGIYKEADAARNQLVSVQRLNQLVDDWKANGGSQGQLAPFQAKLTSYVQALGIDPTSLNLPKDAGPAQAIDAVMRKMALGNIGSNSGGLPANNFSEADRNFIVDIQPSLKDTPEGFKAKLEMVKRMAERSTQKEEMWMQMDEQGKSYSDFRRSWAQYTKANPLFSDDEKKQLRAVGGAKPAPAGGGISEGATATNPATGQRIIFRNGQWQPIQ